MVERDDEVREVHGGRLGVVESILSSTSCGPRGKTESYEIVVQMDDGTVLRCGEGDLVRTGTRRPRCPTPDGSTTCSIATSGGRESP